ncbi:helix-turn-helix domain-containing protein [Actinoplanes sp. NPDC089786]|uniref:helix-turn-helix domain-containing protein n=1 Tax=Actinoplanes sp. NPDC089786 TaxID=3155185 RepID=UPI0034261F51
MTDDLSHVRLNSRQIRTLAHPLRSRLVGELRLNGPATATRLAERFATNTGATSYHLRQLAEVGLVEETDEGTRGRERWWRAAHDVTSWERDDFAGDPDALAAADWLVSSYARNVADRIDTWTRGVDGEPVEWREAAQFNDYILRLDPDDLTAMLGELDEVIAKYQKRRGTRNVLLYCYPVPL